jgi:hypothetical protein
MSQQKIIKVKGNINARGRNGMFLAKRVECWYLDIPESADPVIFRPKMQIEFFSGKSGNHAPLFIEGPARDVFELLQDIQRALHSIIPSLGKKGAKNVNQRKHYKGGLHG